MHVTYLITFLDRKESNTLPYLYIGSKSNCTFDGKNIIDDRSKKIYLGSCLKYGYPELVVSERIETTILGEYDIYSDANLAEHELHIQMNVVEDPRFFNSNNANTSNFTHPDYVSAKHTVTGKVIRIRKDSEKYVSGEYVGVTKGYITCNNGIDETQCDPTDIPEGFVVGRLESSIMRGDKVYNYGVPRTKEQKERTIESRNKFYEENPDYYKSILKKIAETASKTHKGIPKTEESNRKRSRFGLVMLKNKITGECIRVSKETSELYDIATWVNPAILFPPSGTGSRWTTNGIENIKIKESEEPQSGYRYGRTLKRKIQ